MSDHAMPSSRRYVRNQHATTTDHGKCEVCRSTLDYTFDKYGALVPSCFTCERTKEREAVARRYPKLAALEAKLTPLPTPFAVRFRVQSQEEEANARFAGIEYVRPKKVRRTHACAGGCGTLISLVAKRCPKCRRAEDSRRRTAKYFEDVEASRAAFRKRYNEAKRHRMQPGGRAA